MRISKTTFGLILAGGMAVVPAAGLLVAPAWAEQVTGIIAEIDTTTGLVSLEDGRQFLLPIGADMAAYDVGSAITLDVPNEATGSTGPVAAEIVETAPAQ